MQMKWLLMMGVCLWGGANVWAQCAVTAGTAGIAADGNVTSTGGLPETHIAPGCTSFTLTFANNKDSTPDSWLVFFPTGNSPCNVSNNREFASSPPHYDTCIINATTLSSSMTNCQVSGAKYCFKYTVVVPGKVLPIVNDPKVIVDSTMLKRKWWRFFWPF